MPRVSEPRRPARVSKSWRERPRPCARGVAPRLSRRVVHATACLWVSDEVECRMCGEYAPRGDPRSALRSPAQSAGGSGPRSREVSAPSHPQDLIDFLTGRVMAPPSRFFRVELCSTPSKVLRFAPTPLPRGLRTLTAPARSSRTWLLRAGRVPWRPRSIRS
jgi:hypothetical protein